MTLPRRSRTSGRRSRADVMSDRVMIRSYRRVFEVDRRIYRVDRWALPVPGGVPLRAVGYFAAAVVVGHCRPLAGGGGRLRGGDGFVAAGSSAGGGLWGVCPDGRQRGGVRVGFPAPPLRYVVVPLAIAVLGAQVAPDGRTAHRFALDWLRYRWRAHRRSAGRVVAVEDEPVRWDGELAVRWDADCSELRRGRVKGPARVTFNVSVELCGLEARGSDEGQPGDAVVVCPQSVLEVRP